MSRRRGDGSSRRSRSTRRNGHRPPRSRAVDEPVQLHAWSDKKILRAVDGLLDRDEIPNGMDEEQLQAAAREEARTREREQRRQQRRSLGVMAASIASAMLL